MWNDDCEIKDDITVTYFNGANLYLGNDTVICDANTFVLSSPIRGEAYRWQDGSEDGTILASDSDLYILDIEHRCGLLSDSISISFEECFKFYAPNAISPNEDGVNDVFTIYGGEEVNIISWLRVYNRWGAAVFEVNGLEAGDESRGWRGDFKSRLVDPGVYMWVAEIDFANGGKEIRSGEISVVK